MMNKTLKKLSMTGVVAAAAIACYSTAAVAAQKPERVQGTIETIKGDTLVIKPYGGKVIDLTLKPGTKYAWVVRAKLSDIKSGDFIGSAALGPKSHLKAQEVVIFPGSMRGTGEGHYAWSMPAAVANADAHNGAAAMNGAPPVSGTMTNGTVTRPSTTPGAPPVSGTMTNGTVHNKTGGNTLTISYNNGRKVEIMVPANAPVVRFELSNKSVLSRGAKVFVVATPSRGGMLGANFVAVGKNGLMPPM
jgi:hypothetical protein